MSRCCALLVVLASVTNAAAPGRLLVRGSQLIDPVNNKPIRLTGFDMAATFHGNDTAFMRSILPGANVVRLVALLWDNSEVWSPFTATAVEYSPKSMFEGWSWCSESKR